MTKRKQKRIEQLMSIIASTSSQYAENPLGAGKEGNGTTNAVVPVTPKKTYYAPKKTKVSRFDMDADKMKELIIAYGKEDHKHVPC